MNISYHEAHIIIARRIQKKLDRIITEIMIETSSDEAMDIRDRMQLIDAVPSEAESLYNQLESSIDYHERAKSKMED
jgi:phosphopantetheine adenylyltransferase